MAKNKHQHCQRIYKWLIRGKGLWSDCFKIGCSCCCCCCGCCGCCEAMPQQRKRLRIHLRCNMRKWMHYRQKSEPLLHNAESVAEPGCQYSRTRPLIRRRQSQIKLEAGQETVRDKDDLRSKYTNTSKCTRKVCNQLFLICPMTLSGI